MGLPKRITQHKSESDSFAIILYKLKDLGIFKDLTDNDYGIDLEIELTDGQNVTGKYFKAQVKSSIDLTIRLDGIPTVGGIKQSTLEYWATLSIHSHIIAFAVDLVNEHIYISNPLFWQALGKITGGHKTKTIEFISDQITPQIPDKMIKFLREIVNQPSVPDQLNAIKTFLFNFKKIIESYDNCAGSDFGSEIISGNDSFIIFLKTSKILLHDVALNPTNEIVAVEAAFRKENDGHFGLDRTISKSDIVDIFNFKHYEDLSDHILPDINAKDALLAYAVLFPKIGNRILELRKIILNNFPFWKKNDHELYENLNDFNLPTKFDYSTLCKYLYEK